jgi:hypothetical protein
MLHNILLLYQSTSQLFYLSTSQQHAKAAEVAAYAEASASAAAQALVTAALASARAAAAEAAAKHAATVRQMLKRSCCILIRT